MSPESVVEGSITAPGPLDRVLLESLPLSPSRMEVFLEGVPALPMAQTPLGVGVGGQSQPCGGQGGRSVEGASRRISTSCLCPPIPVLRVFIH